MTSPAQDDRQWPPLTWRRKLALYGGAIVVTVLGLVAILALAPDRAIITGSTTDFDESDIVTTAQTTPTEPVETWPEYGYNNAKTRVAATLSTLGPPGRQRWVFDAGSLVEFPPVIEGDIAVFGTNHSKMFGISVKTGKQLWSRTSPGQVASSPAIRDGVAYFTSTSGSLIAVDAKTGTRRWGRDLGKSSETSPTLVGDRLFVGSLDGDVFCFSLSGKRIWKTRLPGDIKSSVAVFHDSVIIGDYSGHVTSLAQSDGSKRWQIATPGRPFRGNGRYYAGPGVAYGRAYIGNANGRMFALNARTGAIAWMRSADDWVYSSPAIQDRTVYFGAFDHKLYALDAASGKVRWTFDAGERISGSATIIGSVLYVSTINKNPRTGNTYGLDPKTGAKLWSFPDGRYTPAVAVSHTIMIVGRRKIYGFTPR